jgi:hypothetical protein
MGETWQNARIIKIHNAIVMAGLDPASTFLAIARAFSADLPLVWRGKRDGKRI